MGPTQLELLDTRRQGVTCEHCGAKLVEYRFTFNKGLAVFLRRLFEAGGPAKTDALGLTYSQRTNSQKLAYWGLAKPYTNSESQKKAGWWEITTKGKQFCRGEISIPQWVFTRRGKVTRSDGVQIFMRDVADGWEYRDDYRRQISQQAKGQT